MCLRAVCFRSDWGKRDKFSSPLASKLINWLNFYVPLCHDQWVVVYCPGGLNRVSILLLNGTNIEILHCIAWNPTKSILRFVVLVLCHRPLRLIELRGQFRGAYTQRLFTQSQYIVWYSTRWVGAGLWWCSPLTHISLCSVNRCSYGFLVVVVVPFPSAISQGNPAKPPKHTKDKITIYHWLLVSEIQVCISFHSVLI